MGMLPLAHPNRTPLTEWGEFQMIQRGGVGQLTVSKSALAGDQVQNFQHSGDALKLLVKTSNASRQTLLAAC
jgi:hypothetical protein